MSGPETPCGHLDVPPDDPVADRLGYGAVALRYAALGLPPFPLTPFTKKPLEGSNGFLDATCNPAVISRWWYGNKCRGVGLRMGWAPGAAVGWATVDLDCKLCGKDGRESFSAWLAGLGLSLPWPPVQHTPSGGEHLLWRLPPGRTMTSRTGVLPGVDIRADGGYIAAWPTGIYVTIRPSSGDPRGGRAVLPYGAWSRCPCQAPVMPLDLHDPLAALPGTSSSGGHGGAGGTGGGHDGEVAATVLSNVLRGLSEAECYEEWLKVAIGRDPSRPFRRADFTRRHYRTALRRAAEIRAAEAASMPEIMAWANKVNRQARDRTTFDRWARREARS